MHQEQASFLHFCYCEAIEFVFAMSSAAQSEQLWEHCREMAFQPEDDLIQMIKDMDGQLSGHLRNELRQFYGTDIFQSRLDRILVSIAAAGDKITSAQELIRSFEEKSEIEMVSGLVKAFYQDEPGWLGGYEWDKVQADKELLLELVGRTPVAQAEDQRLLMDVIRFPEECRARILLLLRQFYRYAFEPYAGRIREFCMKGVEKYKLLFAEEPDKAFRDLAKIDPAIIDRKMHVHISFIAQIHMSLYRAGQDGAADWAVLGIHNDTFVWQREDRDSIEKFLKAVSDKRRLEIIGLLAQRSWYANELAQKLGLTPASILYHMNFLLDLNLVRINRTDNKLYYELEASRLNYFFEQTKQWIFEGPLSGRNRGKVGGAGDGEDGLRD